MKEPPVEEQSFVSFAGAMWPRLVRSAVMMGCSPVEAEDLAQTTLASAFVRWRKIERADRPDAFVHKMLINALRASKRRRWNGERPTETIDASADLRDYSDTALVLRAAIAKLPLPQREVVVLRYLYDMSEQHTADLLHCPTGTVKSRLSRAIAALTADPTLTSLAPEGAES